MDFLKLDRTAFKPQTMAEAANHSEYYKKITWQERLSVTAYLNSVTFQYNANPPPKMDRNQFHAKNLKRNG
jgi:hypothetical protein